MFCTLRQSRQEAQGSISVLMGRELAITAIFSLSGGTLALAASLDSDVALAMLVMLVGVLPGFALAAATAGS
jgi:hypothetical protein